MAVTYFYKDPHEYSVDIWSQNRTKKVWRIALFQFPKKLVNLNLQRLRMVEYGRSLYILRFDYFSLCFLRLLQILPTFQSYMKTQSKTYEFRINSFQAWKCSVWFGSIKLLYFMLFHINCANENRVQYDALNHEILMKNLVFLINYYLCTSNSRETHTITARK